MLRTGPWHRLPLTIRWLKQEYQQEFPSNLLPPMHMPIVYGPVRRKKIKPSQSQQPAFVLSPQKDHQPLHSNIEPNTSPGSGPRCSVCSGKLMVCMHIFNILTQLEFWALLPTLLLSENSWANWVLLPCLDNQLR